MPYNIHVSEFVPPSPEEQERINVTFGDMLRNNGMEPDLECMRPDFKLLDRVASQIAMLHTVQTEQHDDRMMADITDRLYRITAPQGIDVCRTWLKLGRPQKVNNHKSISALHVVIEGVNIANKHLALHEICILGIPNTDDSPPLNGVISFSNAQKELLLSQVHDLQDLRQSGIISELAPELDTVLR